MKRVVFGSTVGIAVLVIFPIWMTPKPVNHPGRHDEKPADSPRPDSAIIEDRLVFPLPHPVDRIFKKPFGIYITPESSPVQPERFSGYHTGADFEVFPEEMDEKITVRAVCNGRLIEKRKAGGYGGVVVLSAELRSLPVTIVYGHLSLASVPWASGDSIMAGQEIGILGSDKSPETDGERKHLHLSIHKGTDLNIRGYVNSRELLANWFDPCDFF